MAKYEEFRDLVLDIEMPAAVTLFLAVRACASVDGYCEHIRLLASYCEIYGEAVNAVIQRLIERGYIRTVKAPDMFGFRTDAHVLKWGGASAKQLERVPWIEWKAIREHVLRRDKFTCTYCHRGGNETLELEVDHIISISQGGTHELSNLVTACWDCNSSKRDKTLERWPGRAVSA